MPIEVSRAGSSQLPMGCKVSAEVMMKTLIFKHATRTKSECSYYIYCESGKVYRARDLDRVLIPNKHQVSVLGLLI